MQTQKKSEQLKEFFLLAFTKEILKSYFQKDVNKIEFETEIKKEVIKEKAKEAVKEYKKPLKLSPKKQIKVITSESFKPLPKPFKIQPKRRLIIPKPNLPARLQYLKPHPTSAQIDLGKLNPLIQDPMVQSIECNGPNENIIVQTPAERVTKIKLSKQEVDETINTFSKASRIPIYEGIFRAAHGKLIISAIISNVVENKFIIKKIKIPSTFLK